MEYHPHHCGLTATAWRRNLALQEINGTIFNKHDLVYFSPDIFLAPSYFAMHPANSKLDGNQKHRDKLWPEVTDFDSIR